MFRDVDNLRQYAANLGRISEDGARDFAEFVERLREHRRLNNTLPKSMIDRLGKLGDKVYAKLAEAGLVDKRSSTTLAAYLGDYVAMRSDVGEETRINWGHTTRNLKDFFGEGRDIHGITPGDAQEWAQWLDVDQGLGWETRKKRHSNAKLFFNWAVKKCVLPSNPFADLESSSGANETRHRFIPPEQAAKILQACPNAPWRLLVALSRYGGLRIPSEALRLKWDDLNWEEGWFWIDGKRHRYQNKRTDRPKRKVPIFPELRPYLEEAFELAEPGEVYALEFFRKGRSQELTGREVNLDKPFTAIIRRAGLEPWPRLWHNLRASRQTELSDHFPAHVVCKWIGNTPNVAKEHYLQVTEKHYLDAQTLNTSVTKVGESTLQSPTPRSRKTPENKGFEQQEATQGNIPSGRYWT